MNNLTLFSLAEDVEHMLNNEDAFDPETGELSESLVAALDATKDKAVAVAAFILNRAAQVNAITEHIDKMNVRVAHLETQNDKLREYLAFNMKRTGISEIRANDGTFTAKLYIDRDSSVEIFDEKQIPAEFMKAPKPPEPKPSKSEIGKILKAGGDVPGARILKRDRLEIK